MNTKVIVVESKTRESFQNTINMHNANHRVFATQTHVNCYDGMMIYTAVLFIRAGEI